MPIPPAAAGVVLSHCQCQVREWIGGSVRWIVLYTLVLVAVWVGFGALMMLSSGASEGRETLEMAYGSATKWMWVGFGVAVGVSVVAIGGMVRGVREINARGRVERGG